MAGLSETLQPDSAMCLYGQEGECRLKMLLSAHRYSVLVSRNQ